MKLKREDLFYKLEPLFPYVDKPGRYLGGEVGSHIPKESAFRMCLVFPDTYEIGESNVGVAILQNFICSSDGLDCERAYLPWADMSDKMREAKIPLLSLESASPVASFDVVGFSISHEMAITNVFEALDLAGISISAANRGEDDPIIVAGGPGIWNAEPLAPSIDAFSLGEGEEQLIDLMRKIKEGREQNLSRNDILHSLTQVQGTYVPSLYDYNYSDNAPFGYATPKENSGAPKIVYKRLAKDFVHDDACAHTIVPNMQSVQDRLSIEIMRGCARGCRFCQAGITYRPVRERSEEDIVAACARGIKCTGFEDVSLMSLSTTDHSKIKEILSRLNAFFEDRGIKVSIPSQRMDSFGTQMAEAASGGKHGGVTFAPEAGTQRLRDIINKNITDSDIDGAVRNAFESGWRRVKLYFMMGLPGERDEDIVAMADVAEHILKIGRESVPPAQKSAVSLSLSVAVFVPKPHTPFQWVGQLELDEVERRQHLLLKSLKSKAIRVSYHDAKTSLLEAVFSKIGREGFDIAYSAWQNGARFDSWTDKFDYEIWDTSAKKLGYDLKEIAAYDIDHSSKLPWEHTSPGESFEFLEREWQRATLGIPTPDCTRSKCSNCGICPTLKCRNELVGVRK